MVKYPGLEWNKERSTRVSMSHQDQKCRNISGGDGIGVGEYNNGKFEKALAPENSGAEIPLTETGDGVRCGKGPQVGRGGCVKHSTA